MGTTNMKEKLISASLFLFNLNYILYNTIGLSNLSKNGIRIFAATLLLTSILFDNKVFSLNKIDLIWIILLSASLLSFNFNDKIINFTYLFILLFTSKSMSIDEILKSSFKISVIGIAIVILFLKLGMIQNLEYTLGTRTRSTFGFKNVNAFSSLIYSFSILYMITREKIKCYHILLSLSFVFSIYRYTDTRTTLNSFVIFIVFYLILSKLKDTRIYMRYGAITKGLISSIILLPIIISMLSPVLLEKYPQLNITTSQRILINTSYIYENSIINFLFGGSAIRDIDNGFLTLTFSLGILFLLLTFYLGSFAISRLLDNKDLAYLSFIISFFYFNLLEALMVRTEISVSVCFWIILYKTATERKDENVREVTQNTTRNGIRNKQNMREI